MAKLFVLLCVVFAHCTVAFQHVKTRTTVYSSLNASPNAYDGLVNKVISKGGAALPTGDGGALGGSNEAPRFELPTVTLPSVELPNVDAVTKEVNQFLAGLVSSTTKPTQELQDFIAQLTGAQTSTTLQSDITAFLSRFGVPVYEKKNYLFDVELPQALLKAMAPDSKIRAYLTAHNHLTMTAPELLAAVPTAALVLFAIVIAAVDDTSVESPYDAGTSTYSVESAAQFYRSKPLFVLKRLIKLAFITGAFNFKLLLDWRFGTLQKNEKTRAKEALVLSTQLGPTFIKLGQALSIRTDLIPEAYALELRQLQDAVPPFDSTTAYDIIKREMGINDVSEKFAKISPRPVASASIGQVTSISIHLPSPIAHLGHHPLSPTSYHLQYLLETTSLLSPVTYLPSPAVCSFFCHYYLFIFYFPTTCDACSYWAGYIHLPPISLHSHMFSTL